MPCWSRTPTSWDQKLISITTCLGSLYRRPFFVYSSKHKHAVWHWIEASPTLSCLSCTAFGVRLLCCKLLKTILKLNPWQCVSEDVCVVVSPFYPKCRQFPILYPFAVKIVFDVDVFRSFIVFWATGKAEGSFVVDSNIDIWDIKPIFQKSLVLSNVAKAFVQHRTYRGQLPQLASLLAVIESTYPPIVKTLFSLQQTQSQIQLVESRSRCQMSVSDKWKEACLHCQWTAVLV